MGKIWLKSPDPSKQCCGCEGKTGPCDSCSSCVPYYMSSKSMAEDFLSTFLDCVIRPQTDSGTLLNLVSTNNIISFETLNLLNSEFSFLAYKENQDILFKFFSSSALDPNIRIYFRRPNSDEFVSIRTISNNQIFNTGTSDNEGGNQKGFGTGTYVIAYISSGRNTITLSTLDKIKLCIGSTSYRTDEGRKTIICGQ